MGLETGTYIDSLNTSNPGATDSVAQGDDHLRLIKSTIKNSFPNITGAMTATHTELNLLDGCTANTTELNYVDVATLGTAEASKAVTVDASKDSTGIRNLTVSGTITIGSNTATTLQAVYPVGSIYMNATVATNPATLLGFGTWAAFGAGKVPIGLDSGDSDFNTVEGTGGSKDSIIPTHNHAAGTLVNASAGAHQHTTGTGRSASTAGSTVGYFSGLHAGATGTALSTTDSQGAHVHTISGDTANAGESATGKNLQPYIVVYMWKRTA